MNKNQIRTAIALFLSTTFVVPAIAFAQSKLMIRLLDTVAKQTLKGYTRPNNVKSRLGYLNEGNQIEIPIKLTKGKKYGFVAVCDENCNDIDLSLKDANERVIREDNGEEKTAVVEYTANRTGRYYISVDMVSCDDAECAYGVGLYRKKDNQKNQTSPTPTPSPSPPTPNPTPTPSPSPTPNPTPTLSPSPSPTPTSSKNELTQQALQQTLDFNKQVNNTFENLLQSGKPVEQAINEVKAMLEANPAEVKPGSIETDGSSLSWETKDGIVIFLNTNEFTNNGMPKGGASLQLPENSQTKALKSTVVAQIDDTNSKLVRVESRRALVIAPFAWEFENEGGDESNEIAELLKKVGYEVRQIRNDKKGDANISLDDFKNLEKYGVIVVTSHGDTRKEKSYIDTGVQLNIMQFADNYNDFNDNTIAINSKHNTIMIGPSFITKYTTGKMPNSLVYLGHCRSLNNFSLYQAFKDKGAKTFFGYNGDVSYSFANKNGIELFTALSEGKSTGQSFKNTYEEIYNPETKRTTRAMFLFTGDDKLVIKGGCTSPYPQKTTFQDSSGNLRNGPKTVKEEDLTQKSGTFKLTGKVLSNERDIYKFQTETPSDIKVEFSFGNPDSGANNESLEVWFASNEKHFISSSGLRDGKPISSGATQTFENVPPGCNAIAFTPLYTVKSGTRTYDVTVTITPRPVNP